VLTVCVIRVHAQIGNAYIGLGDLEEALAAHTVAMEIRKEGQGYGYKLAASLHKDAWILSQQGKNEEAEPLLRRALDIYGEGSKTRGEIGRTNYLMATVLAALCREEYGRRAKAVAVQIREDVLGLRPEQEDTQASYDLLVPFEMR
jgi:tetratricopeptide (TPR) repeat protein